MGVGAYRRKQVVDHVRFYFEGDPKLRPGFNEFLKTVIQVARERRIRFDLVACKSRVIERFVAGLREYPDAHSVLLIDADIKSSIPSLLNTVKSHPKWNLPVEVADGQINFMVQVMESWFLADIEAIRKYYGNSFNISSLPRDNNVEQIPKSDVMSGLKNATAGTSKKAYHKTRHAPVLLASIDATKVRAAAPHCDRLFKELENALNQ
jgi:hypothetical protein